MILPVKHGSSRRRWVLVTSDGRMYFHATKGEALAQEAAIHLSKARAAGHRIPRKAARR